MLRRSRIYYVRINQLSAPRKRCFHRPSSNRRGERYCGSGACLNDQNDSIESAGTRGRNSTVFSRHLLVSKLYPLHAAWRREQHVSHPRRHSIERARDLMVWKDMCLEEIVSPSYALLSPRQLTAQPDNTADADVSTADCGAMSSKAACPRCL